MSNITDIVVHYSATFPDQDYGVKEIDAMHRARGFSKVGYHAVIKRDGTVERGRELWETGAHVRGKNKGKLGVCCIGGLSYATGGNVGVDTRTEEQKSSLNDWIEARLNTWPTAKVNGHRDHVATQCPGYNAGGEWLSLKGQRTVDVTPPVIDAPVFTEKYLSRRTKRVSETKVLQEALRILGYYVHDPRGRMYLIDGKFGPGTERAVKDFQRDQGITVDGEVGPVTWAQLFRAGGIK